MHCNEHLSNLNVTSNFNDIPNKMFSVKLKRAQTYNFQGLIGDWILTWEERLSEQTGLGVSAPIRILLS